MLEKIEEIMRHSVDSEHGLTERELREYFGKKLLKEFLKWTDGHPCMITADRKIVFFPEHISQFLREKVVLKND